MSAARKLSVDTARRSILANEFEASIDQNPPASFRATFSRVSYPIHGDYLTITATLRDPATFHIKSIRVVFLEEPVDNTPRTTSGVKVFYADTAEDPPAEYSTLDTATALTFDPQTLSISGTIDAHVEDGLEDAKSHDLTMSFSLVADSGVR